MQLMAHTMKMGKNGYEGYSCVVLDDDGKEHAVLARPRQHAGMNTIIKAAFEAVKQEAVSAREAQLDQAAEIMAQVRAEKAARETPSEGSGEPDLEEAPLASDGPPETDEEPAPVFEGEDHLEAPSLEEEVEEPSGYTVPEGMPDMTWLKGEIQTYLFQNKIPYEDNMTKAKLLGQVVLESR